MLVVHNNTHEDLVSSNFHTGPFRNFETQTASTNNQLIWTIRLLSPEHCAEPRNLHHHLEPAATWKIMHQNVYATLLNPTCVYMLLLVVKPVYTFKTIETYNFWIKFVRTNNMMTIYCLFTKLYKSSRRDHPYHLFNQSIRYQTPYAFRFTFRSKKTPLTDNNKTTKLIRLISHIWRRDFSFVYAISKSRTCMYTLFCGDEPAYRSANINS